MKISKLCNRKVGVKVRQLSSDCSCLHRDQELSLNTDVQSN